MSRAVAIEEYRLGEEPYYLPQGDEVALFEAACSHHIPVLLKGPTGCGKTRFVEHMAWRLGRPLVTVSCHDDLTAGDLVGRYLIKGGEVVWIDGPLTRAVKAGAICYLDEVVEARKDTTVVIHPLADDRRYLPIEKTGEVHPAHDDFVLAISYNPGYQSVLKDLKQSTRQRFISLELGYPPKDLEIEVVCHESGVARPVATQLVRLAEMTRNLKDQGLEEGASTRLLVHVGRLIHSDIDPRRACEVGIAETLTDDPEMLAAVTEMVRSVF
jgi:nitric oxide reductase NorQ protein